MSAPTSTLQRLAELADAAAAQNRPDPAEVLDALGDVARALKNLKTELAGLDAPAAAISLPDASVELNAVVEATEQATNQIMESSEALIALPFADAQITTQVNAHVTRIFEACSFQDITGQRIAKVVATLSDIDQRLALLAEQLGTDLRQRPSTESEGLINGPQLDADAMSQQRIDDLMADDINQSIDALFAPKGGAA